MIFRSFHEWKTMFSGKEVELSSFPLNLKIFYITNKENWVQQVLIY